MKTLDLDRTRGRTTDEKLARRGAAWRLRLERRHRTRRDAATTYRTAGLKMAATVALRDSTEVPELVAAAALDWTGKHAPPRGMPERTASTIIREVFDRLAGT